ncbi:MAG: enoyl-CoA hydratase/isomerase family protein [Alphaproteobacteria bacterium]|nr:enoyl-CoA hydratase/isomerase family protein [Alphaproteobacteria bacterium]
MSGRIEVDRDGPVAIIRFDNPPLGYLNAAMVDQLDVATTDLAADASVRAIVLTGKLPDVFVRHYDVAELLALAEALRAKGRTFSDAKLMPPRKIDAITERCETMDKVVIAAINGTAMGGGFELCLGCDIRIAQRGPYSLGQPEINIGILAGAGGTQRLARLIGTARALEMSLRGRTLGPDEAAQIGMVHEAVDGSALERALVIARECARKSPLAVKHIKRLVRGANTMPLADGLALERTLFLDLLVSDRAVELMKRMVEGNQDIRAVDEA